MLRKFYGLCLVWFSFHWQGETAVPEEKQHGSLFIGFILGVTNNSKRANESYVKVISHEALSSNAPVALGSVSGLPFLLTKPAPNTVVEQLENEMEILPVPVADVVDFDGISTT
eukprot:IDg16826t1